MRKALCNSSEKGKKMVETAKTLKEQIDKVAKRILTMGNGDIQTS